MIRLKLLEEPTTALVKYDAACRALAAAKSVDEVKELRSKAEAMRAYARQAKNKQLELDASEIRFRAERRLGELIARQKETHGLNGGGRPHKTPAASEGVSAAATLAEAGIDYKLSSRAQQYAAIPAPQFEAILTERRERIEQENDRVTVNLLDASKHVRGTFGTGENEWYTPPEFIAAARDVLEEIDLDPASSDVAQKTVRASAYFSAASNGLAQEWHGRVWLNPPYAQPHIADFVSKMVAERRAGRVTAGIMLTHNYTDTMWFHEAAAIADAICFTRGRVRFIDSDGGLAAPTQGQAFFYFGAEVQRFASRFAEVGFVVVPFTGEVSS